VLALILNLALAVWLFLSAFVMPHSTVTAWNAMVVGLIAAAAALLAYAAPGRPGLRHGTSILAVWLVAAVMLLPHVSLLTILAEVAVGMGFAAVDLLTPVPRTHGEAKPHGAH
jgi:hypothetical protein